jgi:hypothetical protein
MKYQTLFDQFDVQDFEVKITSSLKRAAPQTPVQEQAEDKPTEHHP